MDGVPLVPGPPPASSLPVYPASELPVPALVAAAGGHASVRFLEFFAAAIRNPHTRRACARAAADFLLWCEDRGVPSVAAVQPLHVAAWIELQACTKAAPCKSAVGFGADQRGKMLKSPVTPGSRARANLQSMV